VLSVVLLVVASFAGVGGGSQAFADAADVTFGVQPSTATGPDGRERFDFNVAPSTVISDWVAVTNSSTSEITVRLVGEDATTDYGSGEFTLVGTDVPSTDIGAWTSVNGEASTCPDITADQAQACLPTLGAAVRLQPGEQANVPFTLTVPADATPGDHAGGIAAIYTTTQPGSDGISTPVEVHVGTRVYLRVDGPVSPGMTMSGLVSGYDGGWNPFDGTARVSFDLANAGNSRVSAATSVVVKGPFGLGRHEWQLADTKNLMPGKTAHITADLEGVPAWLLLFADVTVTPLAADGTAASDPLPDAVTASTMTWAVPWTILGAIVVVAGVVLLVRWRRRERRLLDEALAAAQTQQPAN